MDVDNVDTESEMYLKKEMLREAGHDDWDVLITHLLKVDHCGHRYGPNSEKMQQVLKQIDVIIR